MTQVGLAIGDDEKSAWRRGVLMVMAAGTIWSLAGPLVRSMEAAGAWQILFFRSAAVALSVLAVLLWRYRGDCLQQIRRAGGFAVLAGLLLGTAFCGFIFSLMHTTVANAVFVLSASPLLTAVLGWLLLGEAVRRGTWVAMAVALIGVGVMVGGGIHAGAWFGNLMALLTMAGSAGFMVAVRRGHGARPRGQPAGYHAERCHRPRDHRRHAAVHGRRAHGAERRAGAARADRGGARPGLGLARLRRGAEPGNPARRRPGAGSDRRPRPVRHPPPDRPLRRRVMLDAAGRRSGMAMNRIQGGRNEMTPIHVILGSTMLLVAGAAFAADTTIGPVSFLCDDSSHIEATFDNAPDPHTVKLVRGNQTFTLPQAISGSGARYVGDDIEFWNKGDDAMVEWQGQKLECSTAQ
jgi:membrane-bound inhibitor of C-type lysozyme/uncharacterized membrane protein